MNKPILDACCGAKMFHFDRNNPLVLFMDNRKGDFSCHGREILVAPDLVGDFRDMPFDDETFNLVIFDPPHPIATVVANGSTRSGLRVTERCTEIGKRIARFWTPTQGASLIAI